MEMTFSEYALGLFPFIRVDRSEGKKDHEKSNANEYTDTHADFFVKLITHFLQESADSKCKILENKKATLSDYVNGKRPIPKAAAKYIYDHRDFDAYKSWLTDEIEASDSLDSVGKWLENHKEDNYDPPQKCAQLLEEIILDLSKRKRAKRTTKKKDNNSYKNSDDAISNIITDNESSNPPKSKSSSSGAGASIHIDEKYRCCRFCLKWKGNSNDELGFCNVYKEKRSPAGGEKCNYYDANFSRILIHETLSKNSHLK